MKNVYRLTSDKLDGALVLTYYKGLLKGFEIDCKTPLNVKQFHAIMISLPYAEEHIESIQELGLKIDKVIELPTNKKVALFCVAYEKYNHVKYKASRSDGGKIATIKITEELLEHYFKSDNFIFRGKHSISNLVRYYNELLLEIAKKGSVGYPNTWSQEYANKLQAKELSDYWKHLRSIGFSPKKDVRGNVIDWVK